MKLFSLIAAAGLAFITPVAASASVAPAEAPITSSASSPLAQATVRVSVGQDRRHYRGDRRYSRGDQRRHYRRHNGRKAYYRRNCRTYWRHGERRRVCNRVRYWR